METTKQTNIIIIIITLKIAQVPIPETGIVPLPRYQSGHEPIVELCGLHKCPSVT